MAAPRFEIAGTGGALVILRDGQQVHRPVYQSRDVALAKLRSLERRARQRVIPCLRCRHHFKSDGPHNRLCDPCRGLS